MTTTTHLPLVNPPDIDAHTGFILAEDDALKAYLGKIIIPGYNGGLDKPVKVWFRWPTGERQVSYPFITIDLIAVEPRFDLFQSQFRESLTGLYRPSTSPEIPDPTHGWDTSSYTVRNYLPFQLLYQVSAFTRDNLDDRYLRSIFMTDIFPPRPFWIEVDADWTYRRIEVVDQVTNISVETSESGTKRTFRQMYTVAMMAEIPQDRLEDSETWRVLTSRISVSDKDTLVKYFELDATGVDVRGVPGP